MTHADNLAAYPQVIRDRLHHSPHRERTGYPPGYDQDYELVLEQSPENATDDELDTVHLIRQQLNAAFTVEDLRDSRARAVRDAVTTANMLEAAGLTHEADVYRTLALRLTPPVSVGGG